MADGQDDLPENKPFDASEMQGDSPEGERPSFGPCKKRSCTDIWCIPILLVAWVAYLVVTFMGMVDGDPGKLYFPRDYSGSYCGAAVNWNNGPNLQDFPKLTFTMNMTHSTDQIVKQLMCSTAVKDVMVGTTWTSALLTTKGEQDAYLCECCLIPCAKCDGSLRVGGDLSGPADIASTITKRVDDLKALSSDPSSLYSANGPNGDVFQKMFQDAQNMFNNVCLKACQPSTADAQTAAWRQWTYEMAPDNPLAEFFSRLKASGPQSIKDTISSTFTFPALPKSECPYDASRCIPFPGMEFDEVGINYCSFKMASDVVEGVGSAMADAFVGLGGESLANAANESFGDMVGAFVNSIDAFILVCIYAMVVSLLYLVLVRLLAGICVCLAVFAVFAVLLLSGGLCWVRSFQCADAGLLETGQQTLVAGAVATQVAVSNAVSGTDAVDEGLHGTNGAGYIGVQQYTIDGFPCQTWGALNTPAADYTTVTYPNSNLKDNYCRNPYTAFEYSKGLVASTIWCWTQDVSMPWQECRPVGVLKPTCKRGYAVQSEELRLVLEYSGYVLWALAGIYVIIIFCIADRIRLAVAINKVACLFIANKPMITLTPLIQGLLTALWLFAWLFSASFLLSQVPAGYTPTATYATYAEAYGTVNTTGACTDKWPTGFAYREEVTPCFSEQGIEIDSSCRAEDGVSWYSLDPSWHEGRCDDITCKIRCTADGTSFNSDYGVEYDSTTLGQKMTCMSEGNSPSRFSCSMEDGEYNCWKCAPPRYAIDWRVAVSFFVFLWNNALLVAIGQFVIASTVCTWFFTPNVDKGFSIGEGRVNGTKGAIRSAWKQALSTHLGSLAFGAFIIAVIQFLRAVLKYYEEQAKAQKNRIAAIMLKIAQCCMWCLEKCVKFLNKNAYIQIALMGTNFCTSAKRAFFLILRNAIRFGTVGVLTNMIQNIGTLVIVVGTTTLGYYTFSGLHPELSPFVPVIIYVFVSYFIAKLFSSVYSLAVDTCLQCFLICEETGNNEAGDQGFVPAPLERYLKSKGDRKVEELAEDES